jgi:hypothetical protein
MLTPEQKERQQQRRRGERAEHVASWYFRLNGFLSIPGFIVHPDQQRRYPLTEADLIAVRFPNSAEWIDGCSMVDDSLLTALSSPTKLLFLLVEVKYDLCNINGPWSDRSAGNMQRVIRRLGFAGPDQVDDIADAMYSHLRWEGHSEVLQYVSVGKRANEGRQRRYPQLKQIVWDQIADFLFDRFHQFPQKLPFGGRTVHEQWPNFGRFFGKRFRQMNDPKVAREFV